MARPLLRKGRMVPEHEERIQRCSHYIEQEVEARDLTSYLYSSRILDADDRCDINTGETRERRAWRLLEILIMRGPFAYIELVKALRKEGYDHVAAELEDEVNVTHEESRRQGSDVADDRLTRIEDLLEGLSLRVERLESRDQSSDDADDEISHLKKQLFDLKEDTLDQIKELVEENANKDEIIADLTWQLQDRQNKLEKAEERILELENKILDLEDQCGRYRKDIDSLKKQGSTQADRLQRQERKMKIQEEKLKLQQTQIQKVVSRLDTEKGVPKMTDKKLEMAEAWKNLKANTDSDGGMRVVGRNVRNQTRNKNMKRK